MSPTYELGLVPLTTVYRAMGQTKGDRPATQCNAYRSIHVGITDIWAGVYASGAPQNRESIQAARFAASGCSCPRAQETQAEDSTPTQALSPTPVRPSILHSQPRTLLSIANCPSACGLIEKKQPLGRICETSTHPAGVTLATCPSWDSVQLTPSSDSAQPYLSPGVRA